MRVFRKQIFSLFILSSLCMANAYGSFYAEDWIFSRRPDEDATMTSIDRFGPVGLGIELHQPAFVMKIGNVEDNSPAAATGALREGQIIETINGEPLRDIDPRIQLGNIITEAEATDGKIELVVRDNEDADTETVVVEIPVLGSYSETWPLDCEKSDRIVREFADWVATQGPQFSTDGGLRMLFLLSTGEEKDLDVMREWIAELAERHGDSEMIAQHVNWHLGYSAIPVAEYYIRTGDETAIPLIEGLVRAAEYNYMPGGWSTRHTGAWNYMGGGRMSAAGLHVATFLLLASEAGVEVDEDVLHGALRQFIRYAGRGLVAYGDQRPESGYTDNGKNGALAFTMAAAAAVMPDGQDSIYADARDISAMSGFYSTHWMLHGHTGGGVGEIWRSASMGLMYDKDTPRYRSFMDNRTWFYELSRRHDGSFGIVGGERYDNTNWGAGMGLTYTIPRGTLRISGAAPTEHSQEVVLPAQVWGTEADNDFYAVEPATPPVGDAPDVRSERLDGLSGRVMMGKIADGDEDVIRKYLHHPDHELRRRASRRLHREPDVAMEALRAEDARVRFAAVAAVDNHSNLRNDETMEILIEMINDPEESWWVVDRALRALRHADKEMLKPHTERLLEWVRHDDWWMSGRAVELVTPLASDGYEADEIMHTVGHRLAANRRYRHWDSGVFREFQDSPAEVQELLLTMLSTIYESWPLHEEGVVQEPVHPQSEPFFLDRVAEAMVRQDGGMDRLYALSQERYPEQTLAHRDLFLNNQDRLEDSPVMQERLMELTRNELIPEYVVEHAEDLFAAYGSPRGNTVRRIDELAGLYRSVGIDAYGWHDYGPERTEMEWKYHTFEPQEQPPVGEERARLGRYRDVTYPEGMEHWNQPDFDAAAAGWESGLAPFAHRNGEKRAVGGCDRHAGRGLDFCGCGEDPNTFWENEVLLKAGFFEVPPFEDGYFYRILYGGSSHVGYGDGTHIYVNGERIFRRQGAVDRRGGARPMGTTIARDHWDDFESGRVHLAAKSFLKYYPRGGHYGNYLTVFLRRMKLPPLQEELIRGMQLVGMRDADWQAFQDPDSNIDPDEHLHMWDGSFTENDAAVGSWRLVDEVQEMNDFVPGERQRSRRGWRPVLEEIELENATVTSDPLFVWTGNKLLHVEELEALRVQHATVDGQDYLFVEAGDFSQDRDTDWTSPWLVFERQ